MMICPLVKDSMLGTGNKGKQTFFRQIRSSFIQKSEIAISINFKASWNYISIEFFILMEIFPLIPEFMTKSCMSDILYMRDSSTSKFFSLFLNARKKKNKFSSRTFQFSADVNLLLRNATTARLKKSNRSVSTFCMRSMT
jgi:hypothetical protein